MFSLIQRKPWALAISKLSRNFFFSFVFLIIPYLSILTSSLLGALREKCYVEFQIAESGFGNCCQILTGVWEDYSHTFTVKHPLTHLLPTISIHNQYDNWCPNHGINMLIAKDEIWKLKTFLPFTCHSGSHEKYRWWGRNLSCNLFIWICITSLAKHLLHTCRHAHISNRE